MFALCIQGRCLMCPEPSSEKSTGSQIPPPDDGGTMVPSKQSKQQVGTSATSLKTSSTSDQTPRPRKGKAKEGKSPTAESAPQNKKTTSKGKKNPSNKATRSTKSSETLVPVSTLNGEDFCEWSTPYCKEMSRRLLSRIKIGSAGLPSISSSGYVKEETPISWCRNKSYVPRNKNSQRISWPSFTSSRANCMDQEGTRNKKPKEPKPTMRSKKVRINTTPEQAKILRFWMKTHRQTYNEALRIVKDKKAKANMVLKKLVVTRRDSDKGTKFETMKKSPADVRVSAVRALCKNFASAKAAYLQRKRNIKSGKVKNKRKRKKHSTTQRTRFKAKKPFEVKYKSRRLTSDAFDLETKSFWMFKNSLIVFGSNSKYRLNLKVSESLSDCRVQPDHMCKIAYCFGRWYFIIPEVVGPQEEEAPPSGEEPRIVGIDPGLRKAFTCVSNSGRIDEIGIQTKATMDKLNRKSSAILQAIKEATVQQKKRNLTRAWYRLNARAKDLVADLHFKTIQFLVGNYDVIILGKINVQQLVSMKGQSKSNKQMFKFLSHYLFRQRLLMKTSVQPSKEVIIQDESYTTQTCPRCGVLKKDVGSAQVYKCSRCLYTIGRDVSGAANILLRCASEIQQIATKASGKKRKTT